jgi:EF hand
MNQNRSSALAWWAAATILVSAFLLFQVQPVITKKILPWFGGSPAVWTTCVLFFQLVLLGGYAYAHLITHQVQPKWQGVLHLTIVIVAALMLPIVPRDWWKPIDGDMPAMRILALLAAVVGVPYFVLSTTGPLVQAWFARLYPGRSPYRLYSLSNIGSLAALLTYPFLVETTFAVDTQGKLWSLLFVIFAGLIGILALSMWRLADSLAPAAAATEPAVTASEGLLAKRSGPAADTKQRPEKPSKPDKPEPDTPPGLGLRMSWLLLAALASMAFLAITNHLCQDIAVVPFMWVIPLSLYLLSFIICFDNEWWYFRKTFGLAAILMIVWLTAVQNYESVNDGLEYPQRLVAAIVKPPKFDQPEEAEAYAKKPFSQKVRESSPFIRQPFSRGTDKVFDGIDWIMKKLDVPWQSIMKDRRPVALETGETFASLDKNKDGKLTSEELPQPSLPLMADWDANSDGEVSEEEFSRKVGKREPFHLAFTAETYDFNEHVFEAAAAYLLCLFLICMVCHGELVKSKPQPKYLTSFYLSISAGGALGGLFVALICPLIFKTHFEFALAVIGGSIVGWLTIFHDGRNTWLKGREVLQWALAFVLVGTTIFVVRGNLENVEVRRVVRFLPQSWQDKLTKWKVIGPADKDLIAMERNFYGTVRVTRTGDDEDPYNDGRSLYNGRIWHGFQFTSPERQLEPSTYYVSGTGAALAVEENPRRSQGLRVAVIGLGSGSMAAHGKAGDLFRFYDIDPKVEMVARKYFTYLAKSPAKPEVVMGDARLSLERELKQHGSMNYDVIHLDAFSGDAIPAHLLTYEAFALYEKHLRHEDRVDEETKEKVSVPVGIVVVHISNRYLDLEPVVYAIAKKYGYQARTVHKTEEGGPTDTASDWVLVTKNEEFLNKPAVHDASEPLKPDKELLWTDQFTALFPIMK